MATQPNATQRAMVSFTRYNEGTYAGQWVIVGRRGQVRPKLESGANHGRTPWAVHTTERQTENATVKTVFVEVPWRLSSQPLSDEEIARVMDLAREQVGDYTVID